MPPWASAFQPKQTLSVSERQNRPIRLDPRRAADDHALREQPIVADDLGLLFQPIAFEKPAGFAAVAVGRERSEEHPSELQSLMRISYAVFCLTKQIPHTLQVKYREHHQ